MRIQVYSAASEMDTSIVKGYLENAGIPASMAPDNNNFSLSLHVSKGSNVSHSIFVEEDKVKEAKKVLAEMVKS